VYVRNTIPLPVSVVPTLKYHIRNITRKSTSFFPENISPVIYKKRKKRLALALCIKKTNRKAWIYLYYWSYSCYYLIDQTELSCYSEYIRSKISCDSSGYKTPLVPCKIIYYFFCGLMRILVLAPPPLSLFIPWFFVFELDVFLSLINLIL
jgi:hypothetical protein